MEIFYRALDENSQDYDETIMEQVIKMNHFLGQWDRAVNAGLEQSKINEEIM